MKITKTQLKQIIKEELEQALTLEQGYGDPYEMYNLDDLDSPAAKAERKANAAKFQKEKEAKKAKARAAEKCKPVQNKVAQLNFEYSGGGGTQQAQGMDDPRLEAEINKLISGSPDCFDKEVVARAQPRNPSAEKARASMGMKGRGGSAGYRLEQLVREELSKVLNEDINTASPIEVLKQMIYTKVPGKEFGYKIASPENVQNYLEWIQNGVDDNYITGNSPKEGMAKLQEQLAQAVKVIKALQQGIAQGLGTREGDKIFLPDALGLGHEDKMFQGSPDEPLGDAYKLINRTDWVKELSERGLFYDLIEMFKKYYRRVIEPGDYG